MGLGRGGGGGCYPTNLSGSRIHERIILLRFLGIILRVLRLKASVYNVYITSQFQTWGWGGGGGKAVVEETVNSMEENYQDFCLDYVQEFGLG